MAGNDTTKMRAICGQSAPGSITRHAQVSHEPPSTLSLLSVWRSIYRIPNRVSLSSEDAKKIIFEGTGNGCERGKTPRGGRQGTPFNLPRCSSNLCHYRWNKRASNAQSWTSYQSDKIIGDIVFPIPCFLNFL